MIGGGYLQVTVDGEGRRAIGSGNKIWIMQNIFIEEYQFGKDFQFGKEFRCICLLWRVFQVKY